MPLVRGSGPRALCSGLLLTFVTAVALLLSPFAHPVFTGLIGIAVGLVARRRNLAGGVLVHRVGYVVAGYLGAVGLHALWNASAGLGYLPGVYGVIMVPLFGAAMRLAATASCRGVGRAVTPPLPPL